MATTKRSTRKTSSRKRDDSLLSRTGRTVRERPYVSAAIATGAVTAVAAAAAGAFFFSRRRETSDDSSTTEPMTTRIKDGLAEAASKVRDTAMHWMGDDSRDQSDIAEEALTLKETGAKSRRPADPTVEQQTKAGAVAY